MRKLYTFSSIIGMLLLAPSVLADDYSVNGLKYTILSADDHTASVSGYDDTLSENVMIPAAVNLDGTEYTVTEIGASAFFQNTRMKTLSLPNTLKKIGNASLGYCTSLTSLTIPSSVTMIDSYAIYYTNSLSEIIIEDSSTPIFIAQYNLHVGGVYEMYMGRDITFKEYTVDRTVMPFNANKIVKKITIGKNVTMIPDYFFEYCPKLSEIIFEEGCGSIGSNAFNSCTALTELNLPASVKTLGSSAFDGCSVLSNVTLPNDLEIINSSLFNGCSALTSVTLPSNVTSVYASAFTNSGIKNIRMQPMVPPVVAGTFNTSVTSSATLYVRPDCGDAYRAAPGWKDFGNIVESADVAAIEGVETDGSFDGPVRVINMGGVEVYSGAYYEMPRLQPGVYVVTDGSSSRKMIVKPL